MDDHLLFVVPVPSVTALSKHKLIIQPPPFFVNSLPLSDTTD
jgi:hypothetical protein